MAGSWWDLVAILAFVAIIAVVVMTLVDIVRAPHLTGGLKWRWSLMAVVLPVIGTIMWRQLGRD